MRCSASARVIASRSAAVLIAGIALDAVAEPRVIGVAEVEVMHAGLGGNALAGDWARFEQRALVRGRDVQHVQARTVFSRQRDRQFGRLDARFARTDQWVLIGGNVIAPDRARFLFVGDDRRRVLAVRDDRHRCIAKDRIKCRRIVHQHVAGRCAHEHLDAGCRERIEMPDVLDVVVGRAEIERVVDARDFGRARVFCFERRAIHRGRSGVRHFHVAGNAAGEAGARFALDVGLVGEAGLAEVHLVVDHARQQPAAVGIEHALAAARGEILPDAMDAAVADADVARFATAFVDDLGVDDEPVSHRVV